MNHIPEIKTLPFYKELTYEKLLFVEGLSLRGATAAVVYLWYNITHGMYEGMQNILERDVIHFKNHYPEFSKDIDTWLQKNLSNQSGANFSAQSNTGSIAASR